MNLTFKLALVFFLLLTLSCKRAAFILGSIGIGNSDP